MAKHVTKSGRQAVATAWLLAAIVLLADLGHNEIYRFGYTYGETLRDGEGEDEETMDLKDLDATLGELEDQFGESSEASKLFESEDFTEGVTNGYYSREITGR